MLETPDEDLVVMEMEGMDIDANRDLINLHNLLQAGREIRAPNAYSVPLCLDEAVVNLRYAVSATVWDNTEIGGQLMEAVTVQEDLAVDNEALKMAVNFSEARWESVSLAETDEFAVYLGELTQDEAERQVAEHSNNLINSWLVERSKVRAAVDRVKHVSVEPLSDTLRNEADESFDSLRSGVKSFGYTSAEQRRLVKAIEETNVQGEAWARTHDMHELYKGLMRSSFFDYDTDDDPEDALRKHMRRAKGAHIGAELVVGET
jgi:hypothetical protein